MRYIYSSDNTSRKKLYTSIQLQYTSIQLQYDYDEQFHGKQEGKQVSKSHLMMIDRYVTYVEGILWSSEQDR